MTVSFEAQGCGTTKYVQTVVSDAKWKSWYCWLHNVEEVSGGKEESKLHAKNCRAKWSEHCSSPMVIQEDIADKWLWCTWNSDVWAQSWCFFCLLSPLPSSEVSNSNIQQWHKHAYQLGMFTSSGKNCAHSSSHSVLYGNRKPLTNHSSNTAM